jgi:selenide,water dikinase
LAWVEGPPGAGLDGGLDRGGFDDLDVLLMADAQTSGGLVFGAPPERVDEALGALSATGHTAAAIGRVVDTGSGSSRLRLV